MLLFSLSVAGFHAGCSEELGALGQNCYPNDTCNAGLNCIDGRCGPVKAPDGGSASDLNLGFQKCCSLYFSGDKNDWVEVKNNSSLNPNSSAFTLEAWIKPEIHLKNRKIGKVVMKRNEMGENYYSLALGTEGQPSGKYKIQVAFVTANGWLVYEVYGLELSYGWHHIAFQRSKGELDIWLNGLKRQSTKKVQKGSANPDDYVINNEGSFWIGTHSSSSYRGEHSYRGLISELKLSNEAIYKDVQFNPPRTLNVDKTTALLLRFDEGNGISAIDVSKKKNDGTISGCKWKKETQ